MQQTICSYDSTQVTQCTVTSLSFLERLNFLCTLELFKFHHSTFRLSMSLEVTPQPCMMKNILQQAQYRSDRAQSWLEANHRNLYGLRRWKLNSKMAVDGQALNEVYRQHIEQSTKACLLFFEFNDPRVVPLARSELSLQQSHLQLLKDLNTLGYRKSQLLEHLDASFVGLPNADYKVIWEYRQLRRGVCRHSVREHGLKSLGGKTLSSMRFFWSSV